MTCAACIVVDDTGRVLFERDARVSLPNASTTKMVTALVVRKHAALDEEVQISPNASAMAGLEVDLDPGGGYTVEELLLALLLSSSNEAAIALAEHVAGSEGAFVELMNRYTRRLGAEDTSFVTSHGLDEPGHGASAADLALIGERLLEDRRLARMVGTPRTEISGPNGTLGLTNRNLLLESYRGAIGIKTGFTALSGNVLVSAARRQGRTVIAVAMRSVDSFADSAALLDYGFAVLRRAVVVHPGTAYGGLVFEGAGSTALVAGAPVRGLFDASKLDVTFVPDGEVTLPVDAGEAVGVFEMRTKNGRLVAEVDALAERSVELASPSFLQRALGGVLGALGDLFGAG